MVGSESGEGSNLPYYGVRPPIWPFLLLLIFSPSVVPLLFLFFAALAKKKETLARMTIDPSLEHPRGKKEQLERRKRKTGKRAK